MTELLAETQPEVMVNPNSTAAEIDNFFTTAVREAALHYQPESRSTLLEPVLAEVDAHNQAVIEELLKLQEETREGCFFVGLCVLYRKYYPQLKLPNVDTLLSSARRDYSDLLQPDKLLVDHKMSAAAIKKIFPRWGISLTGYSLNSNGQTLIGEQMAAEFEAPEFVLPGYESLSTEGLDYPYAILKHQVLSDDSHFIADDGGYEAANARNHFESFSTPYRTIAILKVGRLWTDEFVKTLVEAGGGADRLTAPPPVEVVNPQA